MINKLPNHPREMVPLIDMTPPGGIENGVVIDGTLIGCREGKGEGEKNRSGGK